MTLLPFDATSCSDFHVVSFLFNALLISVPSCGPKASSLQQTPLKGPMLNSFLFWPLPPVTSYVKCIFYVLKETRFWPGQRILRKCVKGTQQQDRRQLWESRFRALIGEYRTSLMWVTALRCSVVQSHTGLREAMSQSESLKTYRRFDSFLGFLFLGTSSGLDCLYKETSVPQSFAIARGSHWMDKKLLSTLERYGTYAKCHKYVTFLHSLWKTSLTDYSFFPM